MAHPASLEIAATRPTVISDSEWGDMLAHIGRHVAETLPPRAWAAIDGFELEDAPANEGEVLAGLEAMLGSLSRAAGGLTLRPLNGRKAEPTYVEYVYRDGVRICRHRYPLELLGAGRWSVVYSSRTGTYGAWLDAVFAWESRWDG